MFEFIGILFFVIGVILLFIRPQRKRGIFILPLLIGLVVIYLHTLGPLAGKRQKLREVINIDSTSIVEIGIRPFNNRDDDINLVAHLRKIGDQKFFGRFSNAMHKGQAQQDQNKNPMWGCFADILKTDGSVTSVEITKAGSCTIIQPLTKGMFKLYYGTIRADEVGVLLEEFITPPLPMITPALPTYLLAQNNARAMMKCFLRVSRLHCCASS